MKVEPTGRTIISFVAHFELVLPRRLVPVKMSERREGLLERLALVDLNLSPTSSGLTTVALADSL